MHRTSALLSIATMLAGLAAPAALAQTVADVQVAPPSVNLNVGERTSVFATAYDATGNVVPLLELRWTTSNAQVVRVESDNASPDVAVLIGAGAGTATIEAIVGGRRGRATVQVGGGPVAGPAPGVPAGSGPAALLKLEPISLFMLPAEATRLRPVFLRDDGAPAAPLSVTWKSLAPSVATVDADGQAVAISAGQGLIEATAGALVARVPVQVSQTRISIARRGSGETMSPGAADTLLAVVPEQGNRAISPGVIQWRSSDDAVLRVSPFGVVTAVAPGRAEIVATGFLQEVRLPITVHRQVEFLGLSPPARTDTVRIPLGGSLRFMAEAQAADGSRIPEAPVRWLLLDSTVVSFDPATGVATPRRVGVTRLRVSVPGAGLDTAWTISVIAGGVQVSAERAGLAPNDRLKVEASYTDAAGRPVGPASGLRWSSSAPAVAQVDNEGSVVGVAPGRAAIVAATPWGRADTLLVFVQGELLLTATRSGNADIYALSRQAPATLTRITTDPAYEVGGSFSPDGTRIAYVSTRDGNQEVYLVNADGSSPQRLTNTPAQEDSPEWAADGSQLIYTSNATGAYQIWIMKADGTEQRRLTDGPAFNFQPSVSPDGRTIAFASTRDGNYEVYLMDLAGTNQRNYTKSPEKETMPVWFPGGQLGYLREQRTGSGRNQRVTSVVMRSDPAAGRATPATPADLVVTDFAVARDGQLLALVVSGVASGGTITSKVFLMALTTGAAPLEIPAAAAGEQMFAPAFRR